MNKLFKETILKKQKTKTPIWFMRQAGRYLPEYREIRGSLNGFLDLCYNPKLACEVTLQPLKRFDIDAAILFSDILVVPHALGQKLEFKEGEGPVLEKIDNFDKFQSLLIDNIDKFNQNLNPVYETIDLIKSNIDKNKTLIGFAGAPWTVMSYMITGGSNKNFNSFINFARENELLFESILSIVEFFTISYIKNQIKAGVETIQLFDSWAGVLKGEELLKWSVEPIQRIVDEVKAEFPELPVIVFAKGVGYNLKTYISEINPNCVGIDNSCELDWYSEIAGENIVLQGNLSNQTLLSGEGLEEEIIQIMEKFKNNYHIFNLSHGIIKETPINHVEKMIDTIRKYDAR